MQKAQPMTIAYDTDLGKIPEDKSIDGVRTVKGSTTLRQPSTAVTGGQGRGGGGGGGGYGAPAVTENQNQPYIDQLNSLYEQIMGRGKFSYDLNGDMLYRQMADQYTQQGRMAMRDTMGTAAGLTGGYGNSYADQVGNQAYQQYLTQLNNNIPALYDRAYEAWLNEGDQMMQEYQMAATHPEVLNALSPQPVVVSGGGGVTGGSQPLSGDEYAMMVKQYATNALQPYIQANAPTVNAGVQTYRKDPTEGYYNAVKKEQLNEKLKNKSKR